MYLRNGKFYGLEDEWFFKYTKEACVGVKIDPNSFCFFLYNQYSVKEWIEEMLTRFKS